ncbi:hypothetical protein [Neobacillus soli]|uniref:hypothetical protein n=1 Tax=Neobacillus soli TaxID=220688 RepID=UPI000826FA13|nr:hypothetical protein [Neobacillus soli]
MNLAFYLRILGGYLRIGAVYLRIGGVYLRIEAVYLRIEFGTVHFTAGNGVRASFFDDFSLGFILSANSEGLSANLPSLSNFDS